MMTSAVDTRRPKVSQEELAQLEYQIVQRSGDRFTTPQRLFFEALLADPAMNVTKAARSAGIKPATASNWMKREDCRAAIDYLIKNRLRRSGISRDRVLDRIVLCLEMAMGEAPIKKAAYDPATGTFDTHELYQTDLNAAARFTDQLGKHLGLFGETASAGFSVSINLNMAGQNTPQTPSEPPQAAQRVEEGQPTGFKRPALTLIQKPSQPHTQSEAAAEDDILD